MRNQDRQTFARLRPRMITVLIDFAYHGWFITLAPFKSAYVYLPSTWLLNAGGC